MDGILAESEENWVHEHVDIQCCVLRGEGGCCLALRIQGNEMLVKNFNHLK